MFEFLHVTVGKYIWISAGNVPLTEEQCAIVMARLLEEWMWPGDMPAAVQRQDSIEIPWHEDDRHISDKSLAREFEEAFPGALVMT